MAKDTGREIGGEMGRQMERDTGRDGQRKREMDRVGQRDRGTRTERRVMRGAGRWALLGVPSWGCARRL